MKTSSLSPPWPAVVLSKAKKFRILTRWPHFGTDGARGPSPCAGGAYRRTLGRGWTLSYDIDCLKYTLDCAACTATGVEYGGRCSESESCLAAARRGGGGGKNGA